MPTWPYATGEQGRNPVDPVPFIGVAAFGFLFCYSYGPIYLVEFGAELAGALGYSTMVFLAILGFAYYRLVWTARPDLRSEIPLGLRLRRPPAVPALVEIVPLLFRRNTPHSPASEPRRPWLE